MRSVATRDQTPISCMRGERSSTRISKFKERNDKSTWTIELLKSPDPIQLAPWVKGILDCKNTSGLHLFFKRKYLRTDKAWRGRRRLEIAFACGWFSVRIPVATEINRLNRQRQFQCCKNRYSTTGVSVTGPRIWPNKRMFRVTASEIH